MSLLRFSLYFTKSIEVIKGELGDNLLLSLIQYIYPRYIPEARSAMMMLLMNSNELEMGTSH